MMASASRMVSDSHPVFGSVMLLTRGAAAFSSVSVAALPRHDPSELEHALTANGSRFVSCLLPVH